MAELNGEMLAVADLYAQAVLEAAGDADQQQQIALQLGDLVAYIGRDRNFALFLTADTVEPKARRASLERLFRGRMNDLLVNLLQVLNRRKRMGLLAMVYRTVQLRVEKQRQQREVTVETPVPLWHEVRTAIERVIGLSIGKSVLLIEELRPELIGGVVIRVGDRLIDGSLRFRLRALRERLRDRSIREMRAGSRYVAGLEV
jgi:F-type H+-transporting ATPase subunit delta